MEQDKGAQECSVCVFVGAFKSFFFLIYFFLLVGG